VYELLDGPRHVVGAELLKNPGFEARAEADPMEWTRIGSRDEALLDTQAHSGEADVSVTTKSFFVPRQFLSRPVIATRCNSSVAGFISMTRRACK
jgi:hypothetical protein